MLVLWCKGTDMFLHMLKPVPVRFICISTVGLCYYRVLEFSPILLNTVPVPF